MLVIFLDAMRILEYGERSFDKPVIIIYDFHLVLFGYQSGFLAEGVLKKKKEKLPTGRAASLMNKTLLVKLIILCFVLFHN
ncbi:MAG: hypothetical protein Q8R96_19925 [Bacteroidota bacterium]|nr:hypothetical protein [Bacteroidota bacterium]